MSYYDWMKKTENKLSSFERCSELIEYPEIQADKGLYVQMLREYSELKTLSEKYSALKRLLSEREKVQREYSSSSEEEKELFSEELSQINEKILLAKSELLAALGEKGEREKATVLFSASGDNAGMAMEKLFLSISSYLEKQDDFTVYEVKKEYAKNGKNPREISFTAEGPDALACLTAFCGVHKVISASAPEKLACTAVLREDDTVDLNEKDVRIDLFHSSGAGGQNINKVETAIRATHLPTGISVVCQDERSQLKNKKRALEHLFEKLKAKKINEEKERITLERRILLADKRKKFCIDLNERKLLSFRTKIEYPFPLSDEDVARFIENYRMR